MSSGKRRLRERLSEAQNHRCAYCGVALADQGATAATIEHFQPRALGGSNKADNLVAACFTCNAFRASKRPIRTFNVIQRAIRDGRWPHGRPA